MSRLDCTAMVAEVDTQAQFWTAPEKQTKVHVIDTAVGLEAATQLLPMCDACGIDAEWAPGTTEPQAAVLQLAFRRRDNGGCVALVLDMLALPRDEVAHFVALVLAEEAILKLGFGLSADLWAVASRLGRGGTRSVSNTRPVIDLKTLHTALVSARRTLKAPSGLSGLVCSLLGAPLDKTLQCSAWEERPLSGPQADYAATDAIVLLHLLTALVAAVPPDQFPMPDRKLMTAVRLPTPYYRSERPGQRGPSPNSGGGKGRRTNGRRSASKDPHVPLTKAGNVDPGGVNGGRSPKGNSGSCEEGSDSCQESYGSGEINAVLLLHDDEWAGDDGPGNLSAQAAVSAAREHWGEAWTLSRDNHRKQVARHSSTAASFRRKQSLKQHKTTSTGRVVPPLPWAAENGSPRFVADAMCEGVARQLRQCGIDAASCPANPCTERRHVIYRALAESCESEGRVVLTSDATLVSSGMCCHCFHVTGANKREQLAEVLEAFQINIAKLGMLSRCGKCNGSFSKEGRSGEELSAEERATIPTKVLDFHTFWRCTNPKCGQIYWRGTLYERAVTRLTQRLDSLSSRNVGSSGSDSDPSGDRPFWHTWQTFWSAHRSQLAAVGCLMAAAAVGSHCSSSSVTSLPTS